MISFEQLVKDILLEVELLTKSKKTIKGEALNYYTGIMYMSPGNLGGVEVCTGRGVCSHYCLTDSGQLRMGQSQRASLRRKYDWAFNSEGFYTSLLKEIQRIVRQAEKKNMIPCIRLNGTSDIDWMSEKIRYKNKKGETVTSDKNIFELFPNLQFYDYTKGVHVYDRFLSGALPKNYYMLFSADYRNKNICAAFLKKGGCVAMVFDPFIPNEYWGFPCIDGDEHDLRFLDKKQQNGAFIVGLSPKGVAKWRNVPCGGASKTVPTLTTYLQNEPEESMTTPPETDENLIGSSVLFAKHMGKTHKAAQDKTFNKYADLSPEEREKALDATFERQAKQNQLLMHQMRERRKALFSQNRQSPYELSQKLGVKPVSKIIYPKAGLAKGAQQVIRYRNPKTGQEEILTYANIGDHPAHRYGKLIHRKTSSGYEEWYKYDKDGELVNKRTSGSEVKESCNTLVRKSYKVQKRLLELLNS